MPRMLVCLLMLCTGALNALADGVTDILPGGAATYYITAPGSYRLAGNVTMSGDASCIVMITANVQLDLNGHTINAGGVASGGSSYGIYSTFPNVKVTNGTVVGFGVSGISLGGNLCTVENVTASGNNTVGFYGGIAATGSYSSVVNCVSVGNNSNGATFGISIGIGGRAEGNRACNNVSATSAATGISALNDCVLVNNISTDNSANGTGFSATGINSGANCVIERNVCSGNNSNAAQGSGEGRGMVVSSNCTVRGNTANSNMAFGEGSAYGIYALGPGCVIEGNSCGGNREGVGDATAAGIRASGRGCRIVGNACRSNLGFGDSGSGAGIWVSGDGSLIEGNSCSENGATGAGRSSGIWAATNFLRVVRNACFGQLGGASADGILATSSNCLIQENQCTGNFGSPIRVDSAFGGNRIESNRISGSIVQIGGANTIGSGDFANQGL